MMGGKSAEEEEEEEEEEEKKMFFWRPIEPSSAEHLAREGYAVVDDFVRDADAAKTMRDEICSMPIDDDDDDVEEEDGKESDDDASRRDDARLKPNRTHFTDARKNKRYLFSKPGVFEYDMHMKRSTNRERKEGSDGRGTTKTLERFFEATGKHLADAFNDAAKEVRDGVKVKPGDANRTVKLQINTGGAFPYHFDNPGGAQQNRKLTCILYLNEDYEDKCGGEIVLVPFMGPFVTIRPIFNRLVVFYSETVLHRVNKAVNFPGKGRVCLTIWLDGDDDENCKKNANIRNDLVQLLASPPEDLISYIRQTPDAQRFLSRWTYRDEYEISLLESHPGKGLEHMLEAHEDAVKRLRKIKDEELLRVLERVREMRNGNREEMKIIRL